MAAFATCVVLGGAVAGGYGTGVALGRRMAPTSDTLTAEQQDERAEASTSTVGRADPSDPDGPGGARAVPVPDHTLGSPSSSGPPAPSGPPAGSTAPEPPPTTGQALPPPTTPTPPLPPPTDPVDVTRRLAGAAAGGDVDRVWEMLAPAARVVVGGRPGLASRLTGLHDRLTPVRDGTPLAATAVPTEGGVVTVVAPVVPGGEVPLALPFLEIDGRLRLASIEATTDVRWTAPAAGTAGLVVTAPALPAGVAVGDVPVTGHPTGPGELRIPVTALPDGSHRAVAVFVDGDRVSASAFAFSLPVQTFAPPEEPPGPDGTS